MQFRDPANMSPLLQSTERPSPLGAPNNLSSPSSDLSEFDIITNRNKNESLADSNLNNGKSPNNNTNGNDPFDLGHLDDLLGKSKLVYLFMYLFIYSQAVSIMIL